MAASGLSAVSFAAVVTVAVYCVLPASAAVGLNVAVLPLTFTAPVTTAPPEVAFRLKLAVLSVEFVIDSEKVADTEEFSGTPFAASDGDVDEIVGAVVSGTGTPPTAVFISAWISAALSARL